MVSLIDENSNQSSIADSSPVKMENSCSTSPTPEATASAHADGNKCKAEHTPSPDKGTKNHSDHMDKIHV